VEYDLAVLLGAEDGEVVSTFESLFPKYWWASCIMRCATTHLSAKFGNRDEAPRFFTASYLSSSMNTYRKHCHDN
jgi:hypothetical protein